MWKHLRDIWNFKDDQPAFLSSKRVKGIGQPHHVRVFRSRDGSIAVQCKRWLTSAEWTEPVELCSVEQVRDLRSTWPGLVHPMWPGGFEKSALMWLGKLRNLLAPQDVCLDGITHTEKLVQHALPEFLPSGQSLVGCLARLRTCAVANDESATDIAASLAGVLQASSAAFPGSTKGLPGAGKLLHIVGAKSAPMGFCQSDLEDGNFCVYRNHGAAKDRCPVRLGRALRIVDASQTPKPYIVMEAWWPVLRPEKYADQLNMFSGWQRGAEPSARDTPSKRAKTRRSALPTLMVEPANVLVWPVDLEKFIDDGPSPSGRIPLAVFHYLRSTCKVDLSPAHFTFSRRGKAFFDAVVTDIAEHVRGMQQMM